MSYLFNTKNTVLLLLNCFCIIYGLKTTNLDFSGAGFGSKSKYMFGKVTIQLKLVEGDSAGTVTAFYVSENELLQ